MPDAGPPSPVRIFVGADRSQLIAARVLEYSIRRHANRDIRLKTLDDIRLPEPEDPRLRQRTGFSFARFAIPALAGRQGRAIYMDADMLVFRDIEELWTLPFRGAKVVCQEEPAANGGRRRTKQCSVMLLDCEALDWDADEIVRGLGERYSYEELMSELRILEEGEVGDHLPSRWNSLERYDADVCLLHYTDMPTQPWVSPDNPNGWLWTRETRLMLDSGAFSLADLERERDLGYLRPSFLVEVGRALPDGPAPASARLEFAAIDRKAGFTAHAEAMAAREKLMRAIREKEGASRPLLTRAASFARRLSAGRLS